MNPLTKKIKAYKASNKGFTKSFQPLEKFDSSWITKAMILGVLPSLGNVSSLQAQCQGPQATSSLIMYFPANGIFLDVDGDMTNDFVIFDPNAGTGSAAALVIDALNGGAVLTAGGSGTVKNYGYNALINGTNNTNTFSGNAYMCFISGGNIVGPWGPDAGGAGNPGYPTTGYIGILQGGNHGFIQLTIVNGAKNGDPGANYTLTISQAGLSNAPGAIMAGDCGSLILPVELTSFTVRVATNSIHLNWATASESNNAGFEIERSMDGEKYQRLAFVEGMGSTDFAHDYHFEDKTAVKGNRYYYRLKQIDYDGSFEHSEVITASITIEETTVKVFPNPSATGEVNLNINTTSEENWTINVFDVVGKELLSEQRIIKNGISVQQFDWSSLTNGVYFLKMESPTERIYKKVVLN